MNFVNQPAVFKRHELTDHSPYLSLNKLRTNKVNSRLFLNNLKTNKVNSQLSLNNLGI